VTVAIERTGSPKYAAGDQSVITNSFRIILAERVKIDLWTDQQNVPLIFMIESQGVKAIRKGSETLAEAISQELSGVAGKQPFTSEEVSFANEGVTLSGTLTIPKSGIAPFPAVVLISGTGLQDRDDNPGGHSLFKLIAERLSSNGIAVLRHDDRGFGKSSAPAKASSYRDLIDDTKAAVSYLRKRKEIDADHIVLAGHSEGAETAGIVAQEDSKIAGVALLAGVSRSLDSIILEQALYQQALKGTVDPSATERLPDVSRTLVRAVNEAKEGKPDTSLAGLNEYFRQHAAHDPAGTMKMVHCPVLILQGERDTDALAYHSVALALAAAAGGNKHVLLRIVPDIGHDFTPSSPDKTAGVEERSQPNQEILKILEQWAISLLLPKESR
jgi:alpha-beta hydrolase superfamily lysophospholipase